LASIVIGAETLEFETEDGESLASLSYLDDAGEAVAVATGLLGQPTSTTHIEDPLFNGAASSDTATWPGLSLTTRVWGDLLPGEDPSYRAALVVVADSAETVGGVEIRAANGTAVGDDFAQLTVGKPADQVFLGDGRALYSGAAVDLPTSFAATGPDGYVYGAIGWAEIPSASITEIHAPGALVAGYE
jgi:hypothetical protein